MLQFAQNSVVTVRTNSILNPDGSFYTTPDLTYADFQIQKGGDVGPTAVDSGATVAYVASGKFDVTLTATDTDTIGYGELLLQGASGHETLGMADKNFVVATDAGGLPEVSVPGGAVISIRTTPSDTVYGPFTTTAQYNSQAVWYSAPWLGSIYYNGTAWVADAQGTVNGPGTPPGIQATATTPGIGGLFGTFTGATSFTVSPIYKNLSDASITADAAAALTAAVGGAIPTVTQNQAGLATTSDVTSSTGTITTAISSLGSSISGWFGTLWTEIGGAFATLGTAVGLIPTSPLNVDGHAPGEPGGLPLTDATTGLVAASVPDLQSASLIIAGTCVPDVMGIYYLTYRGDLVLSPPDGFGFWAPFSPWVYVRGDGRYIVVNPSRDNSGRILVSDGSATPFYNNAGMVGEYSPSDTSVQSGNPVAAFPVSPNWINPGSALLAAGFPTPPADGSNSLPLVAAKDADGTNAAGTAAIATLSTSLASLATSLATIAGYASKWSGISSLANWLKAIMRKDADAATVTEINAANAAGTLGTFTPTTMSEQAIATGVANLTGTSGGFACTIQTNDTNGNPVPGVTVYAMSAASGGTLVGGPVVSNSSGAATIVLTAGSPWIWQLAAGYTTPAPVQVTIAGPTTIPAFTGLAKFVAPTVGTYAARPDIENIFGHPNIIKWAILSQNDPGSPDGQAEITNRINWAIGQATVDFENALRQGRYQIPIFGPGASVWATGMVARMAGLLLYEHLKPTQRDPNGYPIPDRYVNVAGYVETQLNFVRAGKLRLDAQVTGKGTNAPEATHERSRGAYGPGMGGYGSGPMPPPGPFCG